MSKVWLQNLVWLYWWAQAWLISENLKKEKKGRNKLELLSYGWAPISLLFTHNEHEVGLIH